MGNLLEHTRLIHHFLDISVELAFSPDELILEINHNNCHFTARTMRVGIKGDRHLDLRCLTAFVLKQGWQPAVANE